MTTRRISWPITAIISLGLLIISINASCTRNQRMTTIQGSFASVNAARDEFFAWDLEHRRAILAASHEKAEYEAKLAAYEVKLSKVLTALELTYKALLLAATQNDGPSLSAATAAVSSMFETFAQFKKAADVRDGSDVPGDPPPPAKEP